ncbi:MAG: hypothetical protein AUI14_00040 [Actinobacteria bacterium 13_2_20CM_2_71_6]|nr:MAG: hypothetical protein AUI14_00040 [Actinobacteria bacterium 13_2_20CM_2_71_6]
MPIANGANAAASSPSGPFGELIGREHLAVEPRLELSVVVLEPLDDHRQVRDVAMCVATVLDQPALHHVRVEHHRRQHRAANPRADRPGNRPQLRAAEGLFAGG